MTAAGIRNRESRRLRRAQSAAGAWRRRWGSGARWALTLLLVGFVGVTVWSGSHWLMAVGTVPRDGRDASTNLYLEVTRGKAMFQAIDVVDPGPRLLRVFYFQTFSVAELDHGLVSWYDSTLPSWSETFAWWRISRSGRQWSVPLTYPTSTIALLTLFLW